MDSSDFDELEAMVMADARKEFSETVLDHAMNPRNVGDMPNADGFGQLQARCGDIRIWLKVKDGAVEKATFQTDACGCTVACASMATELAKGKTIADAGRINQEDITKALDGLPNDQRHCALEAAKTLKNAVENYMTNQREPWKKIYGNR